MNTSESPEGYRFDARQFILWLPVYLVIGLALYVLSAGPMYWSIYESYFLGEPSLIQILYLPLVWLSSHSELFGRWMEWYLGLWVY